MRWRYLLALLREWRAVLAGFGQFSEAPTRDGPTIRLTPHPLVDVRLGGAAGQIEVRLRGGVFEAWIRHRLPDGSYDSALPSAAWGIEFGRQLTHVTYPSASLTLRPGSRVQVHGPGEAWQDVAEWPE